MCARCVLLLSTPRFPPFSTPRSTNWGSMQPSDKTARLAYAHRLWTVKEEDGAPHLQGRLHQNCTNEPTSYNCNNDRHNNEQQQKIHPAQLKRKPKEQKDTPPNVRRGTHRRPDMADVLQSRDAVEHTCVFACVYVCVCVCRVLELWLGEEEISREAKARDRRSRHTRRGMPGVDNYRVHDIY